MRPLYGFVASLLLITLAGCATSPSVITDYHGGYDFSTLETFRIIESEQDEDNILISPFTFTHLYQVIEDQLNQRYQPAAAGQRPDFEVRYHVVMEERLDARSFDRRYGFGFYPYGYHFHHHGFGPSPAPRVYSQGSLIVDVVDGATKDPIWRGVSEERLYDRLDPLRQREILSSAMRDILVRFPPVE